MNHIISTEDFNRLLKNGQAKVLTLDAAKALKGKRIAWTFFGYNPQTVSETRIGTITSAFALASRDKVEVFKNRAEEWLSWMSEEKIRETQGHYIILDENGHNTYMNCYTHGIGSDIFDEPTFTCSDADREVYYIELGD